MRLAQRGSFDGVAHGEPAERHVVADDAGQFFGEAKGYECLVIGCDHDAAQAGVRLGEDGRPCEVPRCREATRGHAVFIEAAGIQHADGFLLQQIPEVAGGINGHGQLR